MGELRIKKFSRSRHLRYESMFVDNKKDGEVRSEWASVYVNFVRNKFAIEFEVRKTDDINEFADEVDSMFDGMEKWCNENCSGLWCLWLDDTDPEENTEVAYPLAAMMFEVETDLEHFIKDCALISRLTY